jgi:hypothetical protein
MNMKKKALIMPNPINTTQSRLIALAKIFLGTTFVVGVSAINLVAPYYAVPNVELHTALVTEYEYDNLKAEIIDVVKNRVTDEPTHQDIELFIDLANREIPNCPEAQAVLSDVTDGDDLVDKLIDLLELTCI